MFSLIGIVTSYQGDNVTVITGKLAVNPLMYFTILSCSSLISKFGVHFPGNTDINKCYGVIFHTV